MGHTLHVVSRQAEDSGVPVVLVHGAMDRSTSFGRVARRLRDHTVVRYDRRGYGSSQPGTAISIERHVDDLVAVIGEEPAVVVGHSVGGVIALMAAERSPDLILGVVAYEPPTPWLPWWPSDPEADGSRSPADEAERFMRSMVGDRIWARLPSATKEARRNEGPALLADVASVAGPKPPFQQESIQQSVTVGVGSEATWWHRRGAEELASALPCGHLAVVDGSGHGVHLTDPGALADLIRALLARIGASPTS